MVYVFLINPTIFLQHLVFSPRKEKKSALSSEIGNPSFTGGKPQRIQVRREYQEAPWLGGSVPPGRDWNHKGLVSSWRGRGPRLPASAIGVSGLSPNLCSSRPMLPARTARTPRPTTKPAAPVTEWVRTYSMPMWKKIKGDSLVSLE